MAKNPLSQVTLQDGTVKDFKDNTIVAGDNITITTNSDGERVISAAGGGGIKRISDQYDIYIWDLDPGIYILDAPYDEINPFKYIHYYGKNTSTSYRIAVGRGMGHVMLFVTCSRPGAIDSTTPTFKTWYVIYMTANQTTASSPIMYWGYTGQSTGSAKACILDAMVRGSSGTTTTTAGKVLLSTSSAGMITYSSWSTAGFLKTNTSGVVSIDTNTYGKKLYKYSTSLKTWYKDSSHDTTRHLMVEFVADVSTLSGKSVMFSFYDAAYSGWNISVSCSGVSFSNVRYYIQEDYDDGEGSTYRMTIPVGTINYGEDENEDAWSVDIFWYDLYYRTITSVNLGQNVSSITVTSLGAGTAIN